MNMPVPVQTQINVECNSNEDFINHNNINESLTVKEDISKDQNSEKEKYFCISTPNESFQTRERQTPKVKDNYF